MNDPKQPVSGQPDKDLAADTRPVPSQAEGDLETVEEDLAEKQPTPTKTRAQSQSGPGPRES